MKAVLLSVLWLLGMVPLTAFGLVGEPAPSLAVQEWVQGPPVEIKPGTNIFVVEIWQTGLPSASASAAVFSDLQKRYAAHGVVVAGICDEPADQLRSFVQRAGTNLTFAVGADLHEKTSFSYMNPIGERGVPYIFVVGTNGCVLWHGHSPRGVIEVLTKVLEGHYDLARAKVIEVANRQMGQYLSQIQQGDVRAASTGEALLQNRANDVTLLYDLALQIIMIPQPAKRDFALADAALTQAEKLPSQQGDRVKYARAMYLFESGHADAGLYLATHALAAAQTAEDKEVIGAGLRLMQSQLAAAKAREAAAAANTNHTN
jgi:hypothetical protein